MPVGLIGIDRLKTVPKANWNRMTVAQAMEPISDDLTVTPADDAVKAFNMMNRKQASHLMVLEAGRIVGIITMNDLMSYLTLHLDLPMLQKRLRPST
jgi:signal-transduction protein with cAMP-binding, CBS, and nucleotidyltransferase domain